MILLLYKNPEISKYVIDIHVKSINIDDRGVKLFITWE